MNPFDVTYAGALVAGALSFASPCVLPLVPAYLGFLGGASLDELVGKGHDPAITARVMTRAVAFVLGFATVFVLLGATATLLGSFLTEHFGLLARLSGIVIILFGLHYAGLLRIRFLNYEARFHPAVGPAGPAGAFLVGLAFAFGWTPCVGPVLAGILMISAGQPTIGEGVALLAAYAAGLGLPFLLAAAAIGPFLRFLAAFRRHLRKVEISLGLLMTATGAMIFAGSLSVVSRWLLETFPALARIG